MNKIWTVKPADHIAKCGSITISAKSEAQALYRSWRQAKYWAMTYANLNQWRRYCEVKLNKQWN